MPGCAGAPESLPCARSPQAESCAIPHREEAEMGGAQILGSGQAEAETLFQGVVGEHQRGGRWSMGALSMFLRVAVSSRPQIVYHS